MSDDAGDAEKFVVDLKQPGIGDGVKLGINIPKEILEKLWVDSEFPLDYTSIGIKREEALSVRGRLLDHVWCPISYVHPKKPLFPKDGQIDPEHNEIGQYVLRLWCEYYQEWIDVKVDSFVPIDLGGGTAYEGKPCVYVNPTDDSVWMCILEKAVAKILGNYMQLNGGLVSEGWKIMCGASDADVENWQISADGWGKMKMPFDLQDLDVEWDETTKSYKDPSHACGPLTPEEFFKYVEEWDSKNYLMCAGIVAKKNPNLKYEDVEESEGNLENGLVTLHAYGVLGSYEGHGVQLVRVRNPWGKKQEYYGDWCDASEKWKENPEVAKAVNFQPRVDGVFWMTIQDFCTYFTLVQVLKKSQPGKRAVDTPYEEERAVRVKAQREKAQRIRQELYDNGGWYTDEAVSWRGGEKNPGMRIFEDPALFDMVTKAYMDLWGIPENNAKDFAEHARTALPPKMQRYLANQKKEQSKPKGPAQWMKAASKGPPLDKLEATPGGGPTSPSAAGSGLGAVRALQAEPSFSAFAEKDPLALSDERRAQMLAEDAARIAAMRAEMTQNTAPASTRHPMNAEEAAEIATRDDLTQTEKWEKMGMF
ncbi:unnamed protein product [Durusdinium trenchii]|uniref:Calpain catalytic domain-containing protein n=1 Tax=Durusdinium trenchii TaxID=1381693 RepID=A0ABP0KIY3_9DINO